jgi:HD-like signal output (HDOD) protein
MSILANPSAAPEVAGAAGLPGKTLPPHLLKAMSRVAEINSLPEVTTKIVQVVEDPKSTAQEMHDIVKCDPALATKILRVVNSAFYGLPSQIASLDRAILMLGQSAVKNIALASSLARLFKGDAISDQFTARDLWRHCIAVGIGARALAKRAHAPLADEYFVAGLVHDMGLLVIGQLFPQKLSEVTQRCSAQPQDYCAVELELIGADHQTFGLNLATKWKFPPTLRHAVAYHHDPSPLKAEFRQLATIIYMADTICAKLKHGYYLPAQSQELTENMLKTANVDQSALEAVCSDLPNQITEGESVLLDA